ncbi:MAG: MerR family transcriptional regulator [Acidimicrobiales bacterium]|nr:MerR family transcriptional regulator [Acidimicrobiales bacterium]
MEDELRIDDLAREAGVATTTVRLYQRRRLLPPPRLEGRTGWYGPHHLARLRLIARLQDEGYSLAGIGRLVEAWERGSSLDAVVGAEAQLDAILGGRRAVDLSAADLVGRFPDDALTPTLVQRATALGLLEFTAEGGVRLPDHRFLDTGAALARIGVPLDAVLDEWEALTALLDAAAERFAAVFDAHVLRGGPSGATEGRADAPDGEADLDPGDLDPARKEELGAALAVLHRAAHEVVAAALDASLARVGRDRLRRLGLDGEAEATDDPG